MGAKACLMSAAQPWPDPPPQPLVRLALFLHRQLRLALARMIPQLTVFEDSIGVAASQLLAQMVRLKIPDRLERGAATAEQLAGELELCPDALHRVLRGLAHRGYFQLDRQGRFSNNRLSRQLLSSNRERAGDFARYFASAANVASWNALGSSLRSGESGFRLAHGDSVWDWMARHPDDEATFARAMHGRTFADAPLIARTYPFGEFTSVCDVAGGQGGLLSEIALRHRHLRCALLDLPGVIAQARLQLAERGLGDTCELHEGDIFRSIPAGFDVYLLKNILHDWNDLNCARILSNVAAVMAPHSRLVIVEFVLERNQTDHLAALTDLQMMIATDEGRERSLEEFRNLLERSGLRLVRHWNTASVSLLEAALA